MPDNRSSADIIKGLWTRFETWAAVTHGARPKMRQIATKFLVSPTRPEGSDPNALGRWTNPGERENWRVPLSRIAQVVETLKGTVDDKDSLMLARLSELARHAPDSDVFIAVEWALDFAERHRDVDEQFLVKAYRRATAPFPYRIFDNERSQRRVEECFDAVVREELADLAKDRDDDGPNDDAEDQSELRAKVGEIMQLRSEDTEAIAARREQADKEERDSTEAARKRVAAGKSVAFMTLRFLKKLRSEAKARSPTF